MVQFQCVWLLGLNQHGWHAAFTFPSTFNFPVSLSGLRRQLSHLTILKNLKLPLLLHEGGRKETKVYVFQSLLSPLDCKENKPINSEGNQPWVLTGRTDSESEAPILWPSDEKTPWKRPWCWESVKARGEADDRGWDGWTVSLKRPTWIWPRFGKQWNTGGPGVLWSMGSWSVGHN